MLIAWYTRLYLNHSLLETSATQMFEMGVPKHERTGHKSLEALRTYECSNEKQSTNYR